MALSIIDLVSRRKIALGLVCVAVLGGLVWVDSRGMNFANAYVAVTGHLQPGQRAEVYARLVADRRRIKGIEDIKNLLERVSWISRVDVMRHWPDRITVAVVPEKPIATWNGDAFLDDSGNVFRSHYFNGSKLASLYGPAGSEDEVMEQYQQLAKALNRDGLSISTLKLDERGAWKFTTDGGIGVMLGKDDIMARLQRFLLVLHSKQLAPRVNDVKQIDTRYTNGVAVSWKQVPTGLRVAKTDNY